MNEFPNEIIFFQRKKEVTAACVTDFLETYMEANLKFHK